MNFVLIDKRGNSFGIQQRITKNKCENIKREKVRDSSPMHYTLEENHEAAYLDQTLMDLKYTETILKQYPQHSLIIFDDGLRLYKIYDNNYHKVDMLFSNVTEVTDNIKYSLEYLATKKSKEAENG
jgi:16S rRNA C1402 N4-methylase RsmH